MKVLKLIFLIISIIICAAIVLGCLTMLFFAGVIHTLFVLFVSLAGIAAMVNVYSELVRGH